MIDFYSFQLLGIAVDGSGPSLLQLVLSPLYCLRGPVVTDDDDDQKEDVCVIVCMHFIES